MTDKTKEFIKKAIDVHGDKYDYSKVDYKKSKEKVIIICNEHGEYLQQPSNHLQGNGCKKCGIENTKQQLTLTQNDFVVKANKIHKNAYDYSKFNYVNNRTKGIIICKLHKEFMQKASGHLTGYGCPKCSHSYSPTKEEYIKKANEIHNNKYDYSNIEYKSAKDKLKINCYIHGIFMQEASVHLTGCGCPKCAIISRKQNSKSNAEEFIMKANNIHNNKYDYTQVKYYNSITPVIIECKIHNIFKQTPNTHLTGSGCPKCGILSSANSKTYTNLEFIKKSKKIHGEIYDYSKVNYVNCKEDVIIICKEHGEFIQKPSNHLNGGGCNKCYCNYSKSQIEWLKFIQLIENILIQHAENDCEFQIPNTMFKADGYCKETNTIYEYHGDFWHGNPKRYKQNSINKKTGKTFGELYQNTLNKEQQIRDLGFNLITIWESDWIKLNKCVKILQKKFRISKLH